MQEYGLYYDSKTGTYFHYNAEKQTYEFHSQVSLEPSQSQKVDYVKEPVTEKSKQKKRIKKSDVKVITYAILICTYYNTIFLGKHFFWFGGSNKFF